MSTTYFVDSCELKCKIAKKLIPEQNVYCVPGVPVLEELGGVKFDVVVMNPPFNDGQSTKNTTGNRRAGHARLHVRFIELAIEIGEQVLVICPLEKWFLGKGGKLKSTLIDAKRIASVQIIPPTEGRKLFNGTEVGTLGIIHITTTTNETTEIHNSYGGTKVHVQTQSSTNDIQYASCSISATLVAKLRPHNNRSLGDLLNIGKGPTKNVAPNYFVESGGVPFIFTIGKRDAPLIVDSIDPNVPVSSPDVDVDSWRVGLSHNAARGKTGQGKVISPGMMTSYTVDTFTVSNESEANNLVAYLDSQLVKFLISQVQVSMSISKTAFMQVPMIDLSRSWTDAELFQHFNLTPEEISLITG